MVYDTIIIGAGIAGSTAAIYAARERINFLLISKQFGGQFMESGEVLNYPGVTKTTGAEFAMQIEKQLKFNGVKINEGEEVKEIKKKRKNFLVITDKAKYETRTVIIATGAKARKLRVPGEKKFAKNGVYFCAICDGPLLAGKDVAIVGGGNAALEAVDFMKNIAKRMYLININNKCNAHRYLVDRIKSMKNVEIINSAKTTEIFGSASVEGLTYEKKGKIKELKVQGVIVEIGRMPSTGFLKGFVRLEQDGHVKINCRTETSVAGVFAAGDCASGHEYQYVIAAGQGCMALIKAQRYLSNTK